MITTSKTGHSVIIEGPKSKLDELKSQIRQFLKLSSPIQSHLFIDLQQVANLPSLIPSNQITIKEAFSKKQPDVVLTAKAQNFMNVFGKSKEEEIKLPELPEAPMSLPEVRAKYQIQIREQRATLIIPENERSIVKTVKKYYDSARTQINPNRFQIALEQSNSFIFKIEKLDQTGQIDVMKIGDKLTEDQFINTLPRLLRLANTVEDLPYLSSFKKKAAQYLLASLPSPPTLPLNKIPEFHCEFIGQDYEIPSIDKFTEFTIQIPIYNATFLIEIFCEVLEEKEICNFVRDFFDQKTVYILSILSPFPVAFEYLEKNRMVQLTFADTSIASAHFIYQQVEFALKLFEKLPRYQATLINVDSLYYDAKRFLGISEKYGLSVIRGEDYDINGPAASFNVWILLNKTLQQDDSIIQKLDDEFRTIYEDIQMFLCDQCNHYFSKGYGGQCVRVEHFGERIPFDDGLMEHVTQVSDDYNIRTVNYSCCGEIDIDDSIGCCDMVFPHGHLPQKKDGQIISLSQFRTCHFQPQ